MTPLYLFCRGTEFKAIRAPLSHPEVIISKGVVYFNRNSPTGLGVKWSNFVNASFATVSQ